MYSLLNSTYVILFFYVTFSFYRKLVYVSISTLLLQWISCFLYVKSNSTFFVCNFLCLHQLSFKTFHFGGIKVYPFLLTLGFLVGTIVKNSVELLSRKVFDVHKFESFRACINETKTKNSNYLYGHYLTRRGKKSWKFKVALLRTRFYLFCTIAHSVNWPLCLCQEL